MKTREKPGRKKAKVISEICLDDYDYLKQLKTEGFLWEFIRRNELYKKLYESYSSKYADFPKLSQDRDYLKLISQFSKFYLRYPIDPSNQANHFKNNELKSSFIFNNAADRICWDDDEERPVFLYNIRETGKKLILLIDITKSVKAIRRAFDEVIKYAVIDYNVRKRYLSNKRSQSQAAKRKRVEDWANYIKTYDLINEGRKPKEIARLLLPVEKNNGPDYPASKKISIYYKKGKELIEGGYKDFLQ